MTLDFQGFFDVKAKFVSALLENSETQGGRHLRMLGLVMFPEGRLQRVFPCTSDMLQGTCMEGTRGHTDVPPLFLLFSFPPSILSLPRAAST